MEDRTFSTNNHPTNGISNTFREFIEALVEEVVINGEPFDAQKKWLRKHSEREDIGYETIENNLNDLFEAVKELEEHESKVIERSVKALAEDCYLSEVLVSKILDHAAAVRAQKEVEKKAQEERERKAREEAERKAHEERDRIAKEKAQLQKKLDAERKAREEAERKSREEAERKTREDGERRAREEAERKAKEELEKKQATGELNGHEYVDLGLPSGTLWATCNVGATKPEEFGDYYAWGEINTKKTYKIDSYRYSNGNYLSLTKYCTKSGLGITDNLTTLQGGDDSATTYWGGGWRMPSEAQWNELLENTTNKWTIQNGVNGRLFTAKNGQTLFLPAAGDRNDESVLNLVGVIGYYWSNSLYTDNPDLAWDFWLASNGCGVSRNSRVIGLSVRAVHS